MLSMYTTMLAIPSGILIFEGLLLCELESMGLQQFFVPQSTVWPLLYAFNSCRLVLACDFQVVSEARDTAAPVVWRHQ